MVHPCRGLGLTACLVRFFRPMHYDNRGRVRAFVAKKITVHAAFLLLIGAIVMQGKMITRLDSSSLLASFISGEVDVAGPLSQTAYAEGNNDSNSVVAAGDQSLSTIAIDDPTLMIGATLGGNVMAPLGPSASPTDGEKSDARDEGPAAKPVEYEVADGDTIGSIAQKFSVSNNTILWANKLSDSSTIRPGDKLTIPPTTGVLYTVKGGDTILSIANKFDIEAKDIVEFNKLEDSSKIALGDDLMIPGARLEAPSLPPRRAIADTNVSADVPPPPAAKDVAGAGWLWPTATRHMSQFFGGHHTGLDIDNRSGNVPIFAAKDGVVEYAGWNSGGYGNLTVINHGNGITTLYGHASKELVKPGQKVSKGQVVAIMGSTGRSTGPHLHFEIRRNGRPINPLGMF